MKESTSGGGGTTTSRPKTPPTTARRGRPSSTRPTPDAPQRQSDAAEEYYTQRAGTPQPVIPAPFAASYSQGNKNISRDLREIGRDTARAYDVNSISNEKFKVTLSDYGQPHGSTTPGMTDVLGIGKGMQEDSANKQLTQLKANPPAGFKYQTWMERYPLVAASALKANLTSNDWTVLNNHFRVEDATRELMVAANGGNIQVVYAGIDADVRDLALKNLYDFFNSQDSAATDSKNPEDDGKGFWATVWDNTVGAPYSPIKVGWDTIMWTYDQVAHVNRATVRAWNRRPNTLDTVPGGSGMISAPQFFGEDNDWDATAKGSYDTATMNQLAEEHGANRVTMLLDINNAFNDNPKDPYTDLIKKYGSDPEWIPTLRMYLLADKRTTEFSSLMAGLEGASNGDFGNMVARGAFGAEKSDQAYYQGTSLASDLAVTVATDPFFFASKAIAGARVARLGLHLLANAADGERAAAAAGNIDRMFQFKDVQAWFRAQGVDAEAIANASSLPEKARLLKRMRARETAFTGHRESPFIASSLERDATGQVVPSDNTTFTSLTDEIISNKLYTPEQAADWIKSGLGLELILNGQAARTFPLMPRMSMRQQLMNSLRTSGDAKWAARNSVPNRADGGVLRRKNPVIADSIFEQSATASSVAQNWLDNASALATESGLSGEAKRILGGPRLPVGININWQDAPGVFARDRKGWIVYGQSMTDRSFAANVDRLMRMTESSPTKSLITIEDGRDAKYVGDWARAAGLQKRHVDALKYVWAEASPGQRRIILQGLAKTLVEAKGVHVNDLPAAESLVGRTIDGIAKDAQYGTIIDSAAAREVLQGDRLELAGGDLTPEQHTRKLAQLIFQSARKRKDLQRDYYDTLREIDSMAGRGRAESRLIDLQRHATELEQLLAVNSQDLFVLIRRNGREGAEVARRIGLDVTTDMRAEALNAGAERGPMWQAKLAGDRKVRGAAKDQNLLVDETLTEYKDLQQELRALQKEMKTATNLNRQKLLDRQLELKARIAEAKKRAGLGRWEIKNLISDEQYMKDFAESGQTLTKYDPSVIDDVSHALHVRQTASRIRMPDFAKIQQYSMRTGYASALLGMSYTGWATSLVDIWSLLTLMGPRYAFRNAIEDIIFYDISGGGVRDFSSGRRATKAIRMAEGRSPGILHDVAHARWRPYVSDQELREAIKARKKGDKDPFRQLVAKGMARGKLTLSGNARSAKVDAHLDDLLATNYSDSLLASISETAHSAMARGGSGTGDTFSTAAKYDRDAKTMIGKGNRPIHRNVNFNNPESRAYDSWWTAIHDFAEGDSVLGHRAIAGLNRLLRTPAAERDAVRAEIESNLADAILMNKDKSWSYYQKFSMVDAAGGGNIGAAEMAARYFDEALTIFSGPGRVVNPMGSINRDLVARVMGYEKQYGKGGAVTWVSPTPGQATKIGMYDVVNGEKKYRVFMEDLQSYTPDQRPTAVLGTEWVPVPDAKTASMSDELWAWMGDMYNKIAREPMFISRYLQQREVLGEYEKLLGEQFNPETAKKITTRLAADRAYELVFAYTDNPGNRTMLSWNTRNMARYFRATEDFYRRVIRSARYNPERMIRDALVLHIMNDAGWIHEDDKGEKFFMYPNGIPVISPLMKLLGVDLMIPQGVGFAGKFNMLTPSSDPSAWLPTFSGPFIAAPLSMIANLWQPFEGVQKITLGERSLGRSVQDTVLPPIASSILANMSKDDVNGKYANNLRTVIQGFAAAGKMPGPDSSREDIRQWTENVKTQTEGLTWLQAMLRMIVPASPQLVVDASTSPEVAASGVGGLRANFIKLVNGYEAAGSADPYSDALKAWWSLDPSLSIWTVSKSDDQSTARTQITTDGANWIRGNQDLFDQSREAAAYLMPHSGEFNYEALRVYKAYGIYVPKDIVDYAEEIALKSASVEYYANRDSAEADAEAKKAAGDTEGLKDTQAKWKQYQDKFYAQNPAFEEHQLASQTKSDKLNTLNKLSSGDASKPGLLEYIQANRPDMLVKDPVLMDMWKMINTWKDFKRQYSSAPNRTKPDQADRRQDRADIESYMLNKAGTEPRLLDLWTSLMAPELKRSALS